MSDKKKILIIDDDPDIVETMKIVLSAKSYDVISASNGKEGVDKVESENPDLIILDVMMSEMSEGFQVSYKLKENPRFSRIPILMATAITEKTGIKFSPKTDGEFLPVDDYLEKPVDPDILIERVEKLINRGS